MKGGAAVASPPARALTAAGDGPSTNVALDVDNLREKVVVDVPFTFSPALYLQRWRVVKDVVAFFHATSLLEVGCGDGQVIRFLLSSNTLTIDPLTLVVGLDIHRRDVLDAAALAVPCCLSLARRLEPGVVRFVVGDVMDIATNEDATTALLTPPPTTTPLPTERGGVLPTEGGDRPARDHHDDDDGDDDDGDGEVDVVGDGADLPSQDVAARRRVSPDADGFEIVVAIEVLEHIAMANVGHFAHSVLQGCSRRGTTRAALLTTPNAAFNSRYLGMHSNSEEDEEEVDHDEGCEALPMDAGVVTMVDAVDRAGAETDLTETEEEFGGGSSSSNGGLYYYDPPADRLVAAGRDLVFRTESSRSFEGSGRKYPRRGWEQADGKRRRCRRRPMRHWDHKFEWHQGEFMAFCDQCLLACASTTTLQAAATTSGQKEEVVAEERGMPWAGYQLFVIGMPSPLSAAAKEDDPSTTGGSSQGERGNDDDYLHHPFACPVLPNPPEGGGSVVDGGSQGVLFLAAGWGGYPAFGPVRTLSDVCADATWSAVTSQRPLRSWPVPGWPRNVRIEPRGGPSSQRVVSQQASLLFNCVAERPLRHTAFWDAFVEVVAHMIELHGGPPSIAERRVAAVADVGTASTSSHDSSCPERESDVDDEEAQRRDEDPLYPSEPARGPGGVSIDTARSETATSPGGSHPSPPLLPAAHRCADGLTIGELLDAPHSPVAAWLGTVPMAALLRQREYREDPLMCPPRLRSIPILRPLTSRESRAEGAANDRDERHGGYGSAALVEQLSASIANSLTRRELIDLLVLAVDGYLNLDNRKGTGCEPQSAAQFLSAASTAGAVVTDDRSDNATDPSGQPHHRSDDPREAWVISLPL